MCGILRHNREEKMSREWKQMNSAVKQKPAGSGRLSQNSSLMI
jgi:hypothetical protein